MTDDEIDAAILAAFEMPVTRDIFLKSYERSLFRVGYRVGVEVAAKAVDGYQDDLWTISPADAIRALAD